MNNPRQDKKLPDETEPKSFSYETEIYTIEKELKLEIGPLSVEQEQLFKYLLTEFTDLFANKKNRLGRTNLVTY